MEPALDGGQTQPEHLGNFDIRQLFDIRKNINIAGRFRQLGNRSFDDLPLFRS